MRAAGRAVAQGVLAAGAEPTRCAMAPTVGRAPGRQPFRTADVGWSEVTAAGWHDSSSESLSGVRRILVTGP